MAASHGEFLYVSCETQHHLSGKGGKIGGRKGTADMEKATAFDFSPTNDSFLGITSLGRSDTLPGHHYGPAVRPYYLIHYILAGTGTFRVSDVEYHLHAGQGFLIEPNYQTYYVADKYTPWSYVWVGFTGKYADELVDQLGLSEDLPTFNNHYSYELVDCINHIMKLPPDKPENELLANSYLLRFLSFIARSKPINAPHTTLQKNQYVDQAIHYLSTHIATASTDQLARAVSLDRSYLSGLFKKTTGLTPSQHIRNFRITKARHLLESSQLTIDEIAQASGYEHANSFSRIFKRTYGLNPREYRKQAQGEHR